MNNQELSSLINALIDGEITEQERQALENQMMTSPVVSEELHELMVVDDLLKQESRDFAALGADFTASVGASMSKNIAAQASRGLWLRRVSTGVGIAGAGLGLWFLLQSPQESVGEYTESQVKQKHLQSTLPYEVAPRRVEIPVEVVESSEEAEPGLSSSTSAPSAPIYADIQVEEQSSNVQLTVIERRISLAKSAGSFGEQAYWMVRKAEALIEQGAFDRAGEELQVALNLAQSSAFPQTEIDALGVSSELFRAQGHTDKAEEFAKLCINKAVREDFVDLRRKWQLRLNR